MGEYVVESWNKSPKKSADQTIIESQLERLYVPTASPLLEGAESSRAAMLLMRTPRKDNIKYEVMSHYTNSVRPTCAMCGVEDINLLTLNHVNHDGNQHRRVMVAKDSKGNEHRYKDIYAWAESNGFPEYYIDESGKEVKLDLNILCYSCQHIDAIHYWEDDRINADKKALISIQTDGRNRCSECGRADTRALEVYHYPNFEDWCEKRDITIKTSRYKRPSGMLKYVMEHGKQNDLVVLCYNCQHRHTHGFTNLRLESGYAQNK